MQLSLLPQPEFAPAMPGPGLVQDALAMLLSGETIDQPGFLAQTGSWRLAEYIRNLRAFGWPVQSVEVPAPSASNPRRHIAQYWFDRDTLAAVDAMSKAGCHVR